MDVSIANDHAGELEDRGTIQRSRARESKPASEHANTDCDCAVRWIFGDRVRILVEATELQWQSTTSESVMHKNTTRPRRRLVLSHETVRQLSDREMRIANGAVISTHETITDEMGQCCWVSPVTPCV